MQILINPFLLQTVISNIPSIMVVALIPFWFPSVEKSILLIGFLFFAYRIGNLIGLAVSKNLLGPPNYNSAYLEIINAVSALLLFFLSRYPMDNLLLMALFALYFLKGGVGAIQANLRVRWLKKISNHFPSEKVLVFCQSLIQASFGFAGLVFLFVSDIKGHLSSFLLFDFFTSCVGVAIYISFKSNRLDDSRRDPQNIGYAPWELYVVDFFMALAMGGTNILLLNFGSSQIPNLGGYSAALSLYSVGFLIGGVVSNMYAWDPKKVALGSFMLVGSSLLIAWVNFGEVFQLFVLGFLMLIYPVLFISLEKVWFRIISPDSAGSVFGKRMALITIFFAIGEPLYSALSFELPVRAGLAYIGFIFFFFVVRKTNVQVLSQRGKKNELAS